MILYLRKYDPPIQRHQTARANIKNTTLLDRYFMICMGLTEHMQLESTKVGPK